MNALYRDILNLLSSGLTGKKAFLSGNTDWDKALEIVEKHCIVVAFLAGIKNSDVALPEHYMKSLQEKAFILTVLQERQIFAANKLYSQFEKNQIAYMPLKGEVIRQYYPNPAMRHSGDIDVLIHLEQYAAIADLMSNLGYDFVVESNHEYIWDKPGILHVELHKFLIPSYNTDYYRYYGNGWKVAQKTESSKYQMKKEDFFIYLFTHLAKHFRDGGIGLKHYLDLQVYFSVNKGLDIRYIKNELKKLSLLDFYNNTRLLLQVWFDGETDTELTDILTELIFTSGEFGLKDRKELSGALKEAKTFQKHENYQMQFLKRKIFPDLFSMKKQYPFLKRIPFLLPFAWIWRIIRLLTYGRSTRKKGMEKINRLTKERITEYHKLLNYVGLDFNFEEDKK